MLSYGLAKMKKENNFCEEAFGEKKCTHIVIEIECCNRTTLYSFKICHRNHRLRRKTMGYLLQNCLPHQQRKKKIPKSFIVRPNVPTNNKSVANVYINPEILSAMELNNGNLVLVSSSDSGSAGVVATVYSSNDIVDKMLLPYPSRTDNSVDFCLVIELNSSNL